MTGFSLAVLYVDDPQHSVRFYADLLGVAPIEQSATFAMVPLRDGAALGLWSRHVAEPAATGGGGGTELAFMADDVDATFAAWSERGVPIAQPPTTMDFGRTFVALDPDGHRVRVFRPG